MEQRKEENTAGAKSGGSYICNFLCGGINVCVYILKTTYDDICGCKRNGYYNGRSPLLAHRRCILYWNRMAVFAVWSVSCFGQTGNECGTYGIFTWNTSGVGIYIVCNTGNRCGWHLVVSSIGWALADIVGLLYYKIKKQNLVEKEPEM